jgi:hypothetical protein
MFIHSRVTSGSRAFCARGLAALLIGVSLAACDGALQIQGKVLDSQSGPVVGAAIDASPFPASRDEWNSRFRSQSRADGCFSVAGIVSPFPTKRVPFTVVASGYKPATAEVESPSTTNQVIVNLVSKDSVGESRFSSSGKIAHLPVLQPTRAFPNGRLKYSVN